MMCRIDLTITDADYETTRDLPKRMTASRLLRGFLTAIRTTDREWEKLLKQDDELRETKEWVRDHIVGKFL